MLQIINLKDLFNYFLKIYLLFKKFIYYLKNLRNLKNLSSITIIKVSDRLMHFAKIKLVEL
jgi:hypothetical protein